MSLKAKSAPPPKYRHHKGSNQAFVQVKGRRHYLGVWNSAASKEAYARFLAETTVASIASAAPTASRHLTIDELCAAYLDHADVYYRKNGQPTRSIEEVHAAIRILVELYGETAAADFGPLGLLAIQAKLADGHARSYVNKLVGYVRRIFKWGVSRQMVSAEIHVALTTVEWLKKGRTIAREPKPVKPVPVEVVEDTLPFMPAVVADMVRVQLATGARPGEVCAIRPADITRAGKVWEYRPQSHKTEHHEHQRVIFLGPRAQEVLLPYLLRPSEAHCFSPADSVKKVEEAKRARRKTRVQPSQRNRKKSRPRKAPGLHYTRHSYSQAITRAIKAANRRRLADALAQGRGPIIVPLLPHWHANQLRHTAGTEIRRTYGLEAAQVVLGHSKADITQIYAERDFAKAASVAAAIG